MSNYLIRDDVVQLDRAIYFMRIRIAGLKDTNTALVAENQQLRNRPDQVIKGVTVTRPKEKIDMTVPVKEWKMGQFIKLFQELCEHKYSMPRVVKGNEWRVVAIRFKTFKDAHIEIQDNERFKEYIEWLFKEKFSKKFVATFALICSDSLFYEWLTVTKPSKRVEIPKVAPTAADLKALEAAFEEVRRDK